MLAIRDQQMKMFQTAANERLERDLAGHLVKFFPRHTQFLGEEQLRQVVRHGISSARTHEIRNDYQTFLYVDLMFMLGAEFDRDPQLPWVAEILEQRNGGELQMVEALHSRAMQYFDAVGGLHNEHWIRAMVRARDFELSAAPETAASGWFAESERTLQGLFPEKCRYQGEGLMRKFIEGAIATAVERGMTRFSGVVSYVGHAFYVGCGFERDPLYPWTSALADTSQGEAGARMAKVHAATVEYLKFALEV